MATNLEKMRAKKAQNKTLEASVAASYSIDNINDSIDSSDSNDNKNIVDSNYVAPSSLRATTDKGSSSNRASGKPKEINKSINVVTHEKPANIYPEKSLGLRLASEEDKQYLDLAPLRLSMTKKAFFIELINNELSKKTLPDLFDKTIEEFRNSSLKTAAITIAVPEPLILSIKGIAAKHLMKYQRYIAYVVHKARIKDKSWK